MIIITTTISNTIRFMTDIIEILNKTKNVVHYTRPIDIPIHCDNICYYRSEYQTWVCKKDKLQHMIILMYIDSHKYKVPRYTVLRLFGHDDKYIEQVYWSADMGGLFLSDRANFNSDIIKLKNTKTFSPYKKHISPNIKMNKSEMDA
jgi:hypothetical protein